MGDVATIPLFGVIGDAGSFVSFFFCHGFHRFLRERVLLLTIFLRLAGFFQLFRESVCPAFSVPGSRSDVQRTGGTLFDGLLSILS